jgi:hypothetical protein
MAQIGEQYTPQQNTTAQRVANLPTSPPFQYAHHPKGWQVLGGAVLPNLMKLGIAPGVNHVGQEGDLSEFYMRMEKERGLTFIPYDLAGKVIKGATSYLQRVPVPGGHAHLSVFASVMPGSNRVLPCRNGEWLKFLKACAKVLAPPQVWALEDLKATLELRANGLANKALAVPSAARDLEKTQKDISIVDKAISAAIKRDATKGEEVIIDGTE